MYLPTHASVARAYVVDDKARVLAAIKAVWRERLTTVFVRQGHYAADAQLVASYPPADISVDRIEALLDCADTLG